MKKTPVTKTPPAALPREDVQSGNDQNVPKENRVADLDLPSQLPHVDPSIEQAKPLSSSVDPKGNDPRHPSQGGSIPHTNDTPYQKGPETPVDDTPKEN